MAKKDAGTKSYTIEKVAIATYVSLLLFAVLLIVFGVVQFWAYRRSTDTFEKVMLPISAVVSVFHIVVWVVLQVYLFGSEASLKAGTT